MSFRLSDSELDALERRAFWILENVGMVVRNEEVRSLLAKDGCPSDAQRRVRMPEPRVREMAALHQAKRTRENLEYNERDGKPRKWPGLSGAFAYGPTMYHDLGTGRTMPVDTEVFQKMMKLADATPEVLSVHPWFRQDVPAPISVIRDLVDGLKMTRKVSGLDSLLPEQLQYLVEIGEIVTGRPGSDQYAGGSLCVTPPLILGERILAEALERRRLGIRRFDPATMAMIGVSTPLSPQSAMAIGAAELLGAMTVFHALDPNGDISGAACITLIEMRFGGVDLSAPEVARTDIGICSLLRDRLGLNVSHGIGYGPLARSPGLQAVFENFAAAAAIGMDEGDGVPHYPGRGMLHSGKVGSPVQLMLDLEVHKALAALTDPLPDDQEDLDWEKATELLRINRSFLDTDFPLFPRHEFWRSRLFQAHRPGEGDEAALLAECDAMWRENLARYSPPVWPTETLRALDEVVERAGREFLA